MLRVGEGDEESSEVQRPAQQPCLLIREQGKLPGKLGLAAGEQ